MVKSTSRQNSLDTLEALCHIYNKINKNRKSYYLEESIKLIETFDKSKGLHVNTPVINLYLLIYNDKYKFIYKPKHESVSNGFVTSDIIDKKMFLNIGSSLLNEKLFITPYDFYIELQNAIEIQKDLVPIPQDKEYKSWIASNTLKMKMLYNNNQQNVSNNEYIYNLSDTLYNLSEVYQCNVNDLKVNSSDIFYDNMLIAKINNNGTINNYIDYKDLINEKEIYENEYEIDI